MAEDVGDRIFYACDNYGVASSLADTIQCLNKTQIVCKFDTLDNYCKKNFGDENYEIDYSKIMDLFESEDDNNFLLYPLC